VVKQRCPARASTVSGGPRRTSTSATSSGT